MEKLQINKKNTFKIPIVRIDGVDNGEFIEIDIQDISLPFRCMEALKKKDEILISAKKEQEAIFNKIQKNKNPKNVYKITEETLKMWDTKYNEIREVFDLFLGDGTCQKIFGDKNYASMFDDLIEALQPFLDKIDMSFEGTKEKIENKYSKKKKEVL